MHISNFSFSIKDLYANIKNLYIQKWGRCCGPCLLPHNVVCIVGCFDVAARQDFAGVLVNVDCIPCNGKVLHSVGCNAEISSVFVFAVLFQTPVIRLMFSVACASINVVKRPANTSVCAENPIAAPFGVSVDNHSVYLLKALLCSQSVYLIAII